MATARHHGDGRPEIEELFGLPNPNPGRFSLKLSADAEEVEVAIYSAAMACELRQTLGKADFGWGTVEIPAEWKQNAANGLHYARLTPKSGGQAGKPKMCKFMILR